MPIRIIAFLCFACLYVMGGNLALAQPPLTESDYNKLYCDSIGGKTQVKHEHLY